MTTANKEYTWFGDGGGRRRSRPCPHQGPLSPPGSRPGANADRRQQHRGEENRPAWEALLLFYPPRHHQQEGRGEGPHRDAAGGGEAPPRQRVGGNTTGSRPVAKSKQARPLPLTRSTSWETQVGLPRSPRPHSRSRCHSLVIVTETVHRLLVLSVHPVLFAVTNGANSGSIIKQFTNNPRFTWYRGHRGRATPDAVLVRLPRVRFSQQLHLRQR